MNPHAVHELLAALAGSVNLAAMHGDSRRRVDRLNHVGRVGRDPFQSSTKEMPSRKNRPRLDYDKDDR